MLHIGEKKILYSVYLPVIVFEYFRFSFSCVLFKANQVNMICLEQAVNKRAVVSSVRKPSVNYWHNGSILILHVKIICVETYKI